MKIEQQKPCGVVQQKIMKNYFVIPAAESSEIGKSACLHLFALMRLSAKKIPVISVATNVCPHQNDDRYVNKYIVTTINPS